MRAAPTVPATVRRPGGPQRPRLSVVKMSPGRDGESESTSHCNLPAPGAAASGPWLPRPDITTKT